MSTGGGTRAGTGEQEQRVGGGYYETNEKQTRNDAVEMRGNGTSTKKPQAGEANKTRNKYNDRRRVGVNRS